MRRWLAALMLIAIAAFAALFTAGAQRHIPRSSFVVSVQPDRDMNDAAARLQSLGFTVRAQFDDVHAIEADGPDDATSLRHVEAIAGVRYVEPSARVSAADTPSDPLFGDEYPYLQAEAAPAAWDITTGSPSIVVAVVDTGVSVTHPDLQQNTWVNPGEIANNGLDDDNNGCVDDTNGCSFVSDSSPGCHNETNGFINDDIGHGTFVAGVIAAAANNVGVVGVARNVRIMSVKVLDCYGAGDEVSTARGISYAARNGARVINLSLGGLQDSQLIRDAIAEAGFRGAVVVAAAGNRGSSSVEFPARVPGVLAVAAGSRSDPSARAPFSDWGPEIGVSAVGQDVFGPVPASRCNVILPCVSQGPWAHGDGTSFSAPQVSGLAALMLSLNPGLSPGSIINTIEESATAVPPAGTPGWSGYGRANMAEALRAVRGNRPPGDPCVVASVIDGQSFRCQDGRTVRLLGMNTPVGYQCGAGWAAAALAGFFLPPGRTLYLRYDVTRSDGNNVLAAPLWRGNDGADYNLAIVMVFVGLARSADVGAQNVILHNWSQAAESWARIASWNMWAPGKPFAGGC